MLSYPLAQLTWKRNQKKIHENNKKFLIVSLPNLSYLRIYDAVSLNHTTWNISCMAENDRGKEEASTLLNIIPGLFPFVFLNEFEINNYFYRT